MIFDRVLVGVDDSDYGLEALRQALALRDPQGTVLALTILELGLASHAGYAAPRAAASLERQAEEARSRAEAALEGVPGEARVVRGRRALPTLLAYAESENATRVAVGGKGRSRPRESS